MRLLRALPVPLFVLLAMLLSACGGGGGGGGGPAGVSQLTILEFGGVTLSPAFSPGTLFYGGEVNSTVSQVTLTANTSLSGAVIDVDGTDLGIGSVAEVLPIAEGANVFQVTATAADGSSSTRYVVTITRAAAPVLDGLSVSVGPLSPNFAANTTSYAVAVPFLQREVVVTASTSAAGGTIEIDGVAVASGQPSAPLALGQGANDIVVRVATPDGSRRDYTVTVTRATADGLVERFAGTGSASLQGDRLGSSVAIDGERIAVGAPDTASTGFATGAVVVLRLTGGVWLEEAYLNSPIQGANARFGSCVALEGDTLVVGAAGNNQAFVYERSGAFWVLAAELIPTGLAPFYFGCSAAVSGDTIAVGSCLDDAIVGPDYLESAGSVYVFRRNGATWTQEANLLASNPGQEDYFASSLALDGDTLVVGAPAEDSSSTGIGSTPNESGNGVGAVYVFTRVGTAWAQQAYVKPSDTTDIFAFGASIDVSGDRMAVGTPGSAVNGGDSGEVMVFDRVAGQWSETIRFIGDNTQAYDDFGCSVALDGDVLVVGADGEDTSNPGTNPQQNNNLEASGAAYVFAFDGTAWSQEAFLKASDPGQQFFFGRAVGISGDTVVVGAPDAVTGRAYVFR